jgi:Protein of unknown function (DUF1570)
VNGNRLSLSLLAAIAVLSSICLGQENGSLPVRHVVYEFENELKEAIGEIIVEGEDGGLLLLASDGQLVPIKGAEIKRVTELSEPFTVIEDKELEAKLKAELPQGFRTIVSEHYVIGYNTSDAYAKWIVGLFEKLYKAFYGFWESKDFKLQKPKFKLVALVFATKQDYIQYAEKEVGRASESIIGYYNQNTNRVTTFDLTGISGLVAPGARISTPDLVVQVLSQPQAERNVATIVHEAVHQLAHNSGLQTRLADNPLWVSEGLATFFETPDPNSSRGLGKIGKLNVFCFQNFRDYYKRRGPGSLSRMIGSDSRFRDPTTASDAYAECWAFNYFLLKKKSKEYVAYLKHLSSFTPLGSQDEETRLKEFKQFFGDDLESLDNAFIKYMASQQ